MAVKIIEMISEDKIEARVREMAAQISKDYAGKEIRMIGILRGASFFMCELAKRVTVPVSIDFMSVSSYGAGTESSGVVKIGKDLDDPIEGQHVIVVEDIDLKFCTLLDKPDRRVTDFEVDYSGFVIPDKFVVGWGMDYAQAYRNLPYIGEVIFE